MTPDHGNGRIEDAFWATLAVRLLHPVQVEIIEALGRIGRPLTATDLLRVLDDKHSGGRIERDLRRLARLGATALEGNGRAAAPMGQRAYRLMRWGSYGLPGDSSSAD